MNWELCSSLLAFSFPGATQLEREVRACRGVLQEEEQEEVLVGWSQASRMA